MNLDNDIALITGASRGIGQAIALQLGQQGATVIGTATSQAGADNITAYLAEQNIKGCGKALNVTDQLAIDHVIKAISSEYGPPTVLVNNAGITRDNLLLRMSADEWDTIIDTNLSSVFRMSKACLRGMIKLRRGRIINIASVVGVTGNAGQANYAAAKSGIIGFSKSLAKEVAARRVTVNVVAPGFIDTDMTSGLAEAHKAQLISQIPLNRLGEPADIAAAVGFLASEQAGYITGQTLQVNGGMCMT